MGMDVYGRKNEAACFSTSMWGWRPLHLLISEANQRRGLEISAELLELMRYNEGAGLKTQAECDRLADALDELLREHGETITMERGLTAVLGKIRRWLKPTRFGDASGPLHRISKDRVKEFIVFLRMCGGFYVW